MDVGMDVSMEVSMDALPSSPLSTFELPTQQSGGNVLHARSRIKAKAKAKSSMKLV